MLPLSYRIKETQMDCYLEQVRTKLLLRISELQKYWFRFPILRQCVREATTLKELLNLEILIAAKENHV